MKKINIILAFIILFTQLSCVNGDDYGTPDTSGDCVTLTATKQVSDIVALSTTTPQQYIANDIIEAYVTSSDEGGNFYKSISMVSTDGAQGFSIPVDNYNLYTKFEPGRKVYIMLNNLYYAYSTLTSSYEIGNLYNGTQIGRLSGVEFENIIKRGCDKISEEDLVNTLTINQAKSDANLHKLIEIDAVQFTDASLGKKYYDESIFSPGGATNHQITDVNGNTLIVRVSSYTNFASKITPNGSGKIRGVLTKYNSDYQFMIRTENDVMFSNDRFEVDYFPPIGGTALSYNGAFSENFESYTSGSATTGQKIFPSYINDANAGSKYWYVAAFSGNKYLVMSAFSSSATSQDPLNKTYFIMPVDFSAANSMSFQSQDRFNVGAVLKVYYSTDYTPLGNVANATLTDITSNFTIATGTTGSTTAPFVNSGVYNFPTALTGNGYIIFEYTGGYSFSPALTSNMHLDNIVVN